MKTRNLLQLMLTLSIALFVSMGAHAQINLDQPSPNASVSQVIGLTDVKIEYSAPGVKGREGKVWGAIVPYGEAWRAGANAATKITFSDGVVIGGQEVKAGSYTLFITPAKDGEWTFHLNSKGNSVFAYNDDNRKQDRAKLEADDAVRVKAKPMMVDKSKERLAYMIEAGEDGSGKGTVTLYWEKVMVSFEVQTRLEAMKKDKVEEALAGVERQWRTLMDAAEYYEATDYNKSIELIDQSIKMKPDYFMNIWKKSQIMAGAKKYDGALDLALKAKDLGDKAAAAAKAAGQRPDGWYAFYGSQVQTDIDAWMENASKAWKKAWKKKQKNQ